jgi:acyl-CoA reductase-like NAD-dependent aldehyde dehydrogenase
MTISYYYIYFCYRSVECTIHSHSQSHSSPYLRGNTVVLKTFEVSRRSQSLVISMSREKFTSFNCRNYSTSCSASYQRKKFILCFIIANSSHISIFLQFTGSDRVGKIIAMELEAAKYLKPCGLELGGKAPAIVHV